METAGGTLRTPSDSNLMATSSFQAGKTYSGRFVGDADLAFEVRVIKRTAKFVLISDPMQPGETKRCAIFDDLDGGEFIKPFGSYSMAPCCRSCRVIA
jgi:hypothetical protein